MWTTRDYKGNIISYYEEEEYKALENRLVEIEEMLYKVYKTCGNPDINTEHYFIGALKGAGLLDQLYKRREDEEQVSV